MIKFLKIIIALIVTFTAIGLWAQTGKADDGDALVEYPVPGRPLNIAVEALDHIWFTMPDDNAIGFLDTSDPSAPQFVKHDLPNPGSEPYDIAYHDGFVWFTEKSGNRIGRIDVGAGQLSEYDIPSDGSNPTGIDVAPNGLVWFLEQGLDQLAYFDPGASQFQEKPYTFTGSGLEDVAVVRNDEIWFTATARNQSARYRPSSGKFDSFSTRPPGSPVAFSEPLGITVDRTGTIWTTSFADSFVGRFAEGTLALYRWHPTLNADAGPAHIAFYDAGKRWHLFYSEYRVGSVSRLSTLPDSTVLGTIAQPLSSPNAKPWGVDMDPNGCAWFALSGINAVAEWCIDEQPSIWLPVVR